MTDSFSTTTSLAGVVVELCISGATLTKKRADIFAKGLRRLGAADVRITGALDSLFLKQSKKRKRAPQQGGEVTHVVCSRPAIEAKKRRNRRRKKKRKKKKTAAGDGGEEEEEEEGEGEAATPFFVTPAWVVETLSTMRRADEARYAKESTPTPSSSSSSKSAGSNGISVSSSSSSSSNSSNSRSSSSCISSNRRANLRGGFRRTMLPTAIGDSIAGRTNQLVYLDDPPEDRSEPQVVVIEDKYPKAKIHLLAMLRPHASDLSGGMPSGATTPAKLSARDAAVVERMLNVGIAAARRYARERGVKLRFPDVESSKEGGDLDGREGKGEDAGEGKAKREVIDEMPKGKGEDSDDHTKGGRGEGERARPLIRGSSGSEGKEENAPNLLVGFHAKPSLLPIHVHLISDDFVSTSLKTKKHYTSFTCPEFFIPVSTVVTRLRQGLSAMPRTPAAASAAAKGMQLRCHRCGLRLENMPKLKDHLRDCRF